MEVVIQNENSIRKPTNITMATSVLSRKKGVIVGDDVLKVRLDRACSANTMKIVRRLRADVLTVSYDSSSTMLRRRSSPSLPL